MKKLMKSESVRKSEGKKATASLKEERKKLKEYGKENMWKEWKDFKVNMTRQELLGSQKNLTCILLSTLLK